MAYTATKHDQYRIPCEPAVIGPIRVTRTTGDLNIPVRIPWKNCRLAYAYAVTTTVVATENFTIDFELAEAAGTAMGTVVALTASSAIGDIAEATLVPAACGNLNRDDSARRVINLEVNTHTSAAAAADIYLYFESDSFGDSA